MEGLTQSSLSSSRTEGRDRLPGDPRSDKDFVGIPFAKDGYSFDGANCAGLAWLWYRNEGIDAPPPPALQSKPEDLAKAREVLASLTEDFDEKTVKRGDLVLCRDRKGREIAHAVVAVGGGRYMHTMRGSCSRIENGLTLLRRIGLEPVKIIRFSEPEKLSAALGLGVLADPATLILIAIAIILFAVSYALRPGVPKFRNQKGAYSYDSQFTAQSAELPLGLLLGRVHTAGNSIFTSLADQNTSSPGEGTRWTRFIVLGSAPIHSVDYAAYNIKINGLPYNNKYFRTMTPIGGPTRDGFQINPAQTKDEALLGTFVDGIYTYTNFPSITIYTGAHGISVPTDIRCDYDRYAPVWGLSGCAYLAIRFMNALKYQSGNNVSCTVKGSLCRFFDEDGFIVSHFPADSLAGADGTQTRFKLYGDDIIEIIDVTVNGAPYTELTEDNLSGDVFHVNKLKGYLEFLTPPVASAAIIVEYTYYSRDWSQNPARIIALLLTDPIRGKGFDESKIDWPALMAFSDYCDEEITWLTPTGPVTGPRYTCNYALDARDSLQGHSTKICDSANCAIFLSNGKVVVKARMPGESVFSFDETNILAGTFAVDLTDRTDKANRVRLFYHPADTYNTETDASRDDPFDQRSRVSRIGNNGIVEESLHIPTIDNVGQAERIGEMVLRENVGVRQLVELKTNIRGLALEPMDIVDLTHSSQPTWAGKLFRIEELAYDEADRLVIRASEYLPSAYI